MISKLVAIFTMIVGAIGITMSIIENSSASPGAILFGCGAIAFAIGSKKDYSEK